MSSLSRWLAIVLVAVAAPVFAQPEVRQLRFATNDLIYDPFTARIYASIPGDVGPPLGNTITAIDPRTGRVGPSVFVGSEPGKLAISSDGLALYVVLTGASAIRRVDIPTFTAGLQFTLGRDDFGPYSVHDLDVLPGSPFSIAVARRSPFGIHAGVAVYDDGVQRPVVTSGFADSQLIEFSLFSPRLYGYNNSGDFRRMLVDTTGVTVTDSTRDLITGSETDIEYETGRLFASSGRVIDPESRTLLGTYVNPDIFSGGQLVRPASDLNRVFFLNTSNDIRLRTYDLTSFVLLDTLTIAGVSGTPSSLVRWGADGLAFRTSQDQLFLIGRFDVPAPPTLTVTLIGCQICRTGNEFRARVTVTNPAAVPTTVEVKAGFSLPDGSAMSASILNQHHFDITLPPGTNTTVELFRMTWPASFPTGNWLYEVALITPGLGRTIVRESKPFSVRP